MSPKPSSPCLFCAIHRGQQPAHIVYADERCLAFLDHRPLQLGHILLIPRDHLHTLADLPPELLAPLFAAAQRLARAVEQAMHAQGSFLAINNRVSQSVPHLHLHIVPRNRGDGLRGFFWPRHQYDSDHHMHHTAARIRRALHS